MQRARARGKDCAYRRTLFAGHYDHGAVESGPEQASRHLQFELCLPSAHLAGVRAGKVPLACGEWDYENVVPVTRASPAYTDIGCCRFSFCDRDSWICFVARDGRETPQITFDPFSRQWIYLLIEGPYGILRSAQGWIGERIVFSGLMTMAGINCEWRMTWWKRGNDQFGFVNEERNADGSSEYIDEWRFKRKQ